MRSHVLVVAAVLAAGCNKPAERCYPVRPQTVLLEGYCPTDPQKYCLFDGEPGF
jgi:hypothetical protein